MWLMALANVSMCNAMAAMANLISVAVASCGSYRLISANALYCQKINGCLGSGGGLQSRISG